jgi:DUF4097 and DUF4098 domain-containing protein YvlB
VRVAVTAPAGVHAQLRTASADARLMGELGSIDGASASGTVIAEDVSGNVTFKTASGDITVDSIGGDAYLNTVSGDIRLGAAGGRTRAKLVSGDAEVGRAAGDVTVDSVSGDVAVRSVNRGETTVKSVSGDITVGVDSGTKVWLDVSSMSGDTRSDLDPSDGPVDSVESLRVKATSTSGDVRIKRSAAPATAG